MKVHKFLQWLHNWTHNYNLFIPDENDYDDENDQSPDSATTVRHQRYATRLYIPLLIGKSAPTIYMLGGDKNTFISE